MLIASLGSALASELGAAALLRSCRRNRPVTLPLFRDELEVLIRLMQKTSAPELQLKLVEKLKAGTKLETLVAAGALANARTFGGDDYQGYHAFMALMPAYRMAQRMPKGLEALPVLKVLYRSTARIRTAGKGKEKLQPVDAVLRVGPATQMRDKLRARELAAMEADFAKRCQGDVAKAYNDLQWLVQDGLDVHRVVLPWRAWDMLQLTGKEHAHTLLRQSVRDCFNRERGRVAGNKPEPAIRALLPKLLDEHGLLEKKAGKKVAEDAWIERLSVIVYGPSREQAADAVASALAEGFDPEAVGEAISLAANRLLLHTRNNPRRRDGVHGASVGVHASDAANAWRNIARVTNARNQTASLIVGAYHTAGQTKKVDKKPLAYMERSERLRADDVKKPDALLKQAAACVESRDQVGACAAVHRYGELGHPPGRVFDLMLQYAVSEDGALHAEKYFHTAAEEFESMRPAFRWRQLVALARVTASEYGEPAPGQKEARRLLKG
jgi:hypothetical protein